MFFFFALNCAVLMLKSQFKRNMHCIHRWRGQTLGNWKKYTLLYTSSVENFHFFPSRNYWLYSNDLVDSDFCKHFQIVWIDLFEELVYSYLFNAYFIFIANYSKRSSSLRWRFWFNVIIFELPNDLIEYNETAASLYCYDINNSNSNTKDRHKSTHRASARNGIAIDFIEQ